MSIYPARILKRVFTGNTNITTTALRKWHIVLAVLFLAQAAAVVLFGTRHDLPLMATYLTTDSLQTKLTGDTVLAPAIHQLLTLNVALLTAIVLGLAGLYHLVLASVYRVRYEAALKRGVHAFRWVLYAVDGGLLLGVIAMLAGLYDLAGLLMLAALAAVAALTGWAVELHDGRQKARLPASLCAGIVAAVALVLVVALYLVASSVFGNGHLSAYIYVLAGVTLALLAAVGANMLLIAAKVGKWANYMYGESWYMGLGLIVKTVFAWLVFAAVLRK